MAARNIPVLTSRVMMCGVLTAVWVSVAFAVTSVQAQTEESQQAGKTIMARGDVIATDPQQRRELSRRDPVFMQDLVATGINSAAQLRMADGGMLSLQEDSELNILDYEFNPSSREGKVRMSLLKGGLRTVTGLIQQSSDNYQLTTPVASIGVRGTHYEAEMRNSDLFLAAWNGIIDVRVSTGTVQPAFSLGPTQQFQFAVVHADGTVEFLLAPPTAFAKGHSRTREFETLTAYPFEFAMLSLSELVDHNDAHVNNDFITGDWILSEGETFNRSGQVVFDDVIFASLTSTQGLASDFAMSMSVDFSASRITTGNLSFNDEGGAWFAAFNGNIDTQGLDVSINFASHNNQIARGVLDGIFIDNESAILGNFALSEQEQPDIQAGGTFLIRDKP
ncbi:FecR domain-containing protein [Aestuariibacter sp. GS-14]|uniref:FecR family protein n=1 Tax=Aestuariibacter sp. GS-14 TaxID=2590670 RepID=UPI0011261F8A|nr:FecR family protein [Aestuariibacter sp. GS-14]TPV62239.1 FecR domain-containing protein [Aestuariibacter sp. GS-14]